MTFDVVHAGQEFHTAKARGRSKAGPKRGRFSGEFLRFLRCLCGIYMHSHLSLIRIMVCLVLDGEGGGL